MKCSTIKGICLTAVFLLIGGLGVVFADGEIVIEQTASTTFPITIDKSGSYILGSNLIGSPNEHVIYIIANNVHIDLNGFTIMGSRKSSSLKSGISGKGASISVVNGKVRDCKGDGIFLWGESILLENVDSSCNGQMGFNVSGAVVIKCTASSNAGSHGFRAGSSVLSNCISTGNGNNGFYLVNSSAFDCISQRNKNAADLEESQVEKCIFQYNTNNGIRAFDSIIRNCNIIKNKGTGIHCFYNNRIENNNVRFNSEMGIFVENDYNYIVRNSLSGNGVSYSDELITMVNTDNYIPKDGPDANIYWQGYFNDFE
ncbi:MAG: right-handed parallel beta-helix repeat-containing protein [Spirochaetales bacterium]|nr:right-handed parallel beta-helix repeat-containing protein [Spirochaetales bacterium]